MVLVAILLPVLFALAGIAVNFAYIQVVDTKVKIVADAAVRAAGREYVSTGEASDALAAAQQMAQLNPIDGFVVPISAGDLEYGRSSRTQSNTRFTFEADAANGNAVRLTTLSLANGSGNAPRPFFPIFGSNFDIRPTHSSVSTQSTLDVALVVDRSGSMSWTVMNDESPVWPDPRLPGHVPLNCRWVALVDAVDIFLSELTTSIAEEQVSLVSYAIDTTEDQTLSLNYEPIRQTMDAFSTAFTGGGTNIHGGIIKGKESLENAAVARPWAIKAMVLMSDGVASSGTGDPLVAAQIAADNEITIYTVSFSEGADQTAMANIAALTGGRHYHADTDEQLAEAFKSIAQAIPSLMTQ